MHCETRKGSGGTFGYSVEDQGLVRVFKCYKHIKQCARKLTRQRVQGIQQSEYDKLNGLYRERNMTGFWNAVKRRQRKRISSTLKAQTIANFYKTIMQDSEPLTADQGNIAKHVKSLYQQHSQSHTPIQISAETVSLLIQSLKRNSAPGLDGITAEHLRFGDVSVLYSHLATLYSAILTWTVVPEILTVGLIVPVIKKPALDPNSPSSYRPITLSSTHAKLTELLMKPPDNVSSSQFGFRSGRGTSMACSLFNDISSYFNARNSPLYVCSLDAEKCFDTLWHSAPLI